MCVVCVACKLCVSNVVCAYISIIVARLTSYHFKCNGLAKESIMHYASMIRKFSRLNFSIVCVLKIVFSKIVNQKADCFIRVHQLSL